MGLYIIDQESFSIITSHVLDFSSDVARGNFALIVLGEIRKSVLLTKHKKDGSGKDASKLYHSDNVSILLFFKVFRDSHRKK